VGWTNVQSMELTETHPCAFVK